MTQISQLHLRRYYCYYNHYYYVPQTDTLCSTVSPAGEVEGGGGGKFHGVDLLQHSPFPSAEDPLPHQPRSLEPITDTFHQNLPLRKTHSDLETTSPAGVWDYQGKISQCIGGLSSLSFTTCCRFCIGLMKDKKSPWSARLYFRR